jgi:hypothetical protein
MFVKKIKSIFQTLDITAPAPQPGFEDTRAITPESSFAATEMAGDTSFGDTQIVPGQINYYQCVCGQHWDGVWTSACNDKCPACGKDTAPRND